ncbi:glycosyltransferase [Novipirellula maiorica]|uniref:glycosyltransferase n=1 Tax=Novipirellula maiorica TaxID=1265734 RepID=UPI001181A2CE|nr:glycosyltransferase [Rhodopirellula maiorica]
MNVESIDANVMPLPKWMRFVFPGKAFSFLSHQIRHLQMVASANRRPASEYVLFLDATCWSVIALLLSPLSRRSKLLYLSMFHQQLACTSSFRRFSLKLLRQLVAWSGAQVVLLECDDDCVEPSLRFDANQKVVLPMPRSTTFVAKPPQSSRSTKKTLRVGLGGTIRPQKGTLDSGFLSAVISGAKQSDTPIELVAGFPNRQGFREDLPGEIEFVDTEDYDDYVRFIQSLDVLVVNLRRDHYWYRSSGVVHDALSAGVFVIVNDYPVASSQVSTPVEVGGVYSEFEEVTTMLRSLPEQIGDGFKNRNMRWNDSRSPKTIEKMLVNAICHRSDRARSNS